MWQSVPGVISSTTTTFWRDASGWWSLFGSPSHPISFMDCMSSLRQLWPFACRPDLCSVLETLCCSRDHEGCTPHRGERLSLPGILVAQTAYHLSGPEGLSLCNVMRHCLIP